MNDFEKNKNRVGIRIEEERMRRNGFTSMTDFVIKKINSSTASVDESHIRSTALQLVAERPELKEHMWEDGRRRLFSYHLQRLAFERYIEDAENDPKHAKYQRRIAILKSVLKSLPETAP